MALITGEIGSMPELKSQVIEKKEDADFQSHDDDKIIDTNEKVKKRKIKPNIKHKYCFNYIYNYDFRRCYR